MTDYSAVKHTFMCTLLTAYAPSIVGLLISACVLCVQLYIPKEGVCIAFSPSGVRAPQRATQGQQGRPAATAEPYAEEAFALTRRRCFQREVRSRVLHRCGSCC